MANAPIPPGPNKTTEGQIGPKKTQGDTTEKPYPIVGTLPTAVDTPPLPTNIPRDLVERHSPKWGRINLTPWVSNLIWTKRIREPWTTIEVTLSVPFANMNVLPDPDDVIVIRGVDGGCRAWGFVEAAPDPPLTAFPQGSVASHRVTVNAISWLSRLRTAQVYASPGDVAVNAVGVGTLFSLDQWTKIALEVIERLSPTRDGGVGPQLQTIVQLISRLRLPASLGDGFLGDLVATVWNQSQANIFAQGLPVDPILGPTIWGLQTMFPNATNALEFILGISVPDSRLIEFWEDVKPNALDGAAPPQAIRDIAAGAAELATLIGGPIATSQAVGAGVSTKLQQQTNLGRRLLGGTPFLVYRIVPFRTEPLGDYIARGEALAPKQPPSSPPTGNTPGDVVTRGTGGAITPAELFATWNLADNYPGTTWRLSDGAVIDAETEVFDFRARRQDSDRINAVTVTLPGATTNPVRLWTGAGLPIRNDPDIERHGLRLYQISWPFFSPNDPQTTAYMRNTAALGAMMFLGQERFRIGSFSTYLRSGMQNHPDIRIGRPCTLILANGITFTCYVESISTQVTVGEKGEVFGRSTVQFSRGVYNPPGLADSAGRAPVSAAIMPLSQTSGPAKSTPTGTNASPKRTRASGVLFNGQYLPWSQTAATLDWRLLNKDLGTRQKRTQDAIDMAVLHYTDGAVTSLKSSGAYAWFNNPSSGVDSHFIIEADGTIVQIMDLALTAYQAGVSSVNVRSIGIDFVCPKVSEDRPAAIPPWTYVTSTYTRIAGATTRSRSNFFSPTNLQLESCRVLLNWANQHLGVALTAPVSSANGEYQLVYSAGPYPSGIYHHAEVFSGRQDCLGIYIPRDLL